MSFLLETDVSSCNTENDRSYMENLLGIRRSNDFIAAHPDVKSDFIDTFGFIPKPPSSLLQLAIKFRVVFSLNTRGIDKFSKSIDANE